MRELAKPNRDVFWKMVFVVFAVPSGIGLAGMFLPELFAVWATALLVMLLSYWIPPRPDIRFVKWIINSWRVATLIFMLATAYVLIKNHFIGFIATS
jgi:membrane-anchored protein YejM (alkaline phosphatase superfamily)